LNDIRNSPPFHSAFSRIKSSKPRRLPESCAANRFAASLMPASKFTASLVDATGVVSPS